ncbi:alpha/beta fold hydrolase [Nocardia sp. NPDC127579]|uniref:alpha/beta fold hydrolase n=1 Tax=Nocardia sp. NPDC127579 TaxID=3345402 RepID=UPI003644DC7F
MGYSDSARRESSAWGRSNGAGGGGWGGVGTGVPGGESIEAGRGRGAAKGADRARWAAVIAALVLVLVPVRTTSAGAESGVAWQACPAAAGAGNALCATISVPLNYADAGGPRIEVMVSRIPAAGPSKGVLFGNPGGPGADALGFWAAASGRVPELREFELVAVQPRGLRWSTPLSCSSPVDSLSMTLRMACEVQRPGYPETVTTETIARDTEEVRRALGVERISFLGISWGTNLGAVYGTLFPQHTDKLVLDSNVDPNTGWAEQTARVPAGVSRRLEDMLDWIAANDSIYGLGDTRDAVRAEWRRQIGAQNGGWFAPTVQATTFAAYTRTLWPYLAQGMREYRDDPQQLRFLTYLSRPAAVTDPTSGWMRTATQCNEDGGVDLAALTGAAVTALAESDPFRQQEAVTRAGITCVGWPRSTTRVRADGGALTTAPLLLQSRHDPATSGAAALSAALHGSIIWVGGGDHGNFTRDNPILNQAVLHYLRTGEVTRTEVPEPPITTPNPPATVPGS